MAAVSSAKLESVDRDHSPSKASASGLLADGVVKQSTALDESMVTPVDSIRMG